MTISGRGCALEMSAKAECEGVVVVARRNGGQAGTGITVLYSSEFEGDVRLPRCSTGTVVVQPEVTRSS